MNYFFLIICSILLSGDISAIKITPNKPKLCVDCKHYTKDFFSSNKYGQCSLFMIEYDNKKKRKTKKQIVKNDTIVESTNKHKKTKKQKR